MGLLKHFTDKPIKDNPVFVQALGLCPVLAVSTSLKNGLAMGVAATAVLIASNILISIIRKAIPRQIRIACYIVVIAGFVTIVEILMKALLPVEINKALGIFIPLIVVNCIILGRAEAFASKHGVLASTLDGLGIGLGFIGALALISTVREILGAGTLWGFVVIPGFVPANVMIMAPGAFLVIGLLFGLFHYIGQRRRERSLATAAVFEPEVGRDIPEERKAKLLGTGKKSNKPTE
ncbi:MAG: electron transport complex subunit RsxE [Planctomycetia bacterium]|nr:electron transport complex subunit RsxE [Planctomycetia bacterium]